MIHPSLRRQGKRDREYQEWRQTWLAAEAARLGNRPAVCGTCRKVADQIVNVAGVWKYLNQMLCVGHRRGRLSHPEDKMAAAGVDHQCYRCNAKQSGGRFADERPVDDGRQGMGEVGEAGIDAPPDDGGGDGEAGRAGG